MTNAIYARRAQGSTALGSVILVVASSLSAVLVIAGLFYATGAKARNQAALAAAGCEPNLSPSGLQCVTRQQLAGEYKAITNPVFLQLNTDAAGYAASRRHLAEAEAVLRAEATSETALGGRLATFPFPPAVAQTAKAAIRSMRALGKLTAEQAGASSLVQMRSFNARVTAASASVQTEFMLISKGLAKAPTAAQEP